MKSLIIFLVAFLLHENACCQNTLNITLFESTGNKDTLFKQPIFLGAHYQWYEKELVPKFKISFFKDGKQKTYKVNSPAQEIPVIAQPYDSIRIEEFDFVLTEIPTFYIENTTWILTVNKKAKPYCIHYNLWNPRRKYSNRTRHISYNNCDCCEDENFLTIDFHSYTPKTNYDTILRIRDSIENFIHFRERSIMHFLSKTLNRIDNCHPLISKEIFTQKQKPQQNIVKLLCRKEGWKSLAYYQKKYDTISFNQSKTVKRYDKGKIHFSENSKLQGTYSIENDTIFETILNKIHQTKTYYTFKIIVLNDECFLYEIVDSSLKNQGKNGSIRHLKIPN